MASQLSKDEDIIKRKLLLGGCKVVERSWGHLVIMPDMAMALSYFRSALAGYSHPEVVDENYAVHDKTISEEGKFLEFGKRYGISKEYQEKYKKQFAYLKGSSQREKVYWIVEDAIRNGDPRKVNAVAEISDKLTELVYEINPSLRLDVNRQRVENGPIWDAGLIASGDPLPCWEDRTHQRIKRGSGGDGAYRIIINTDTSFGRSDSENCLVMCAMINVLQQYADVEVWVQQGWLSNHERGHQEGHDWDDGRPMDGITLFPAFRGSGLNPAQLMFWCGHPMRDCLFSNLINKSIGRVSSGTSETAELDCDLYTRNGTFDSMPPFNLHSSAKEQEESIKALAGWTAKQLSHVLLEEQDLSDLQTN
jgi:hypothetical protein